MTVDPTADTTTEPDETVEVALETGTGYIVESTAAVVGTITDSAIVLQPGIIGFDNSAYSVGEDGISVNEITLIRTDGSDGEVSVTLTPTDDTAISPADYDASPVTVIFADGEISKTVVIPVIDDSEVESDETVNLILSDPTGDATLGTQATAVLTITDNDVEILPPSVTLAVSPASVLEDGTESLIYTFTLTEPAESDLVINYSFGGTADGEDYTGTDQLITIAAGSTAADLVITPIADIVVEADETLEISIVAGAGYEIGTTTPVVGTIANDDASPPPTTSSSVIFGTENNDVLSVPADSGRYTVVSKGGDDTIQLDSQIQVITELPSGGTDTVESSTNYNLAGQNGLENLILTGTENINGIGNRLDNRIQGNSGQNRLTGLQGIDTFVFEFGHSPISAPDTIRDFELGTETIDILTEGGTVNLQTFSNAGSANPTTVEEAQQILEGVFLDADATIANAQPLEIYSGAFIDIVTTGIAGRYLLINDGVAGFQAESDLVINVTNAS